MSIENLARTPAGGRGDTSHVVMIGTGYRLWWISDLRVLSSTNNSTHRRLAGLYRYPFPEHRRNQENQHKTLPRAYRQEMPR